MRTREHVVRETERGRVVVSAPAVEQIAGHAVSECYGVVGMAGRRRSLSLRARDRVRRGIDVHERPEGIALDVHVVVEHGLNLAEVAGTVRSRVTYEVERHTGLRVVAVEVHVDDVKQSG